MQLYSVHLQAINSANDRYAVRSVNDCREMLAQLRRGEIELQCSSYGPLKDWRWATRVLHDSIR